MNEEPNGLLLYCKCQSEQCSQLELFKTRPVGYIRCELTRYCSNIKCNICESVLKIEELQLINSRFKLSGMIELKREPFSFSSNKKEITNLKINLSSIAYADIDVTPYDKNSEIEDIDAMEYLKFCTVDNIILDSVRKIVYFEHLSTKKGLNLQIDRNTSLSCYSVQLEPEFSIPFHFCDFYLQGKRIYELEKNFESSENFCIQIIDTKELKPAIISFIIKNSYSVNTYIVALEDSTCSKTIYDALMVLRCTYDLGTIFRGSFTLADPSGRRLKFKDRIINEIYLETYFPEDVITASIYYQNNLIDSFSFKSETKFNLIVAQCSIFVCRDKKNLDFYFNGNKVTKNFKIYPSPDINDLNIYITENDTCGFKFVDENEIVCQVQEIQEKYFKRQLCEGINFEIACLNQNCSPSKQFFQIGLGFLSVIDYILDCSSCKDKMKILKIWLLNCNFRLQTRNLKNNEFRKNGFTLLKDNWHIFIYSEIKKNDSQVIIEAIEAEL